MPFAAGLGGHRLLEHRLDEAGLFSGVAATMRLETWRVADKPLDYQTTTEGFCAWLGDMADAHDSPRQAAIEAAHAWWQALLGKRHPSGTDWLYLHGPYGTGKTHIALGLLFEVMCRTGGTGAVLNWTTAVEQTVEGIGGAGSGFGADVDFGRARIVDLLVLDDLDKTDGSPFNMRKLYSLIDARLMMGLPTILTANRPMPDLVTYWTASARPADRHAVADRASAIVERLAAAIAQEIPFSGPSYRLTAVPDTFFFRVASAMQTEGG